MIIGGADGSRTVRTDWLGDWGGWVPACARTREGGTQDGRPQGSPVREGEDFTPILTFPPQGGREREKGE